MRSFLALAIFSFGTTLAAAEGTGAQNLLRILHEVQDRIAKGDGAAGPMQNEILRELERSLGHSASSGFSQELSAIGFALSGARSDAAMVAVARIAHGSPHKALADAVGTYLSGDMAKAHQLLAGIDPRALDPRLTPYVAMAKGTAAIGVDSEMAMANFELASLVAPGTLIEEVALRRLVVEAAREGERDRFRRAANLYLRRYSASPFFRQFSAAFVDGAVKLYTEDGIDSVAQAMDAAEPAQRTALYPALSLRLTLEGRLKPVAELAKLYFGNGASNENTGTLRMTMYRSLAELRFGDAVAARASLAAFDRSALDRGETQILDAALAIAETMLGPIKESDDPIASVRSKAKNDYPPPPSAPDDIPVPTTDSAATVSPPVNAEIAPLARPADLGNEPVTDGQGLSVVPGTANKIPRSPTSAKPKDVVGDPLPPETDSAITATDELIARARRTFQDIDSDSNRGSP